VQSALDAAVAQCKATLQAAKAACNGDPTCIEQVEVVAFQCRDDARDAAKPGFASCRAGFKSCVQACPPPASPSGAFLD
jgi:TPP-dependent indolepyruvate ferredoxin oxidoreductase alpha subunit